MIYKYFNREKIHDKKNLEPEDLSAGRVIRHKIGYTNYPVKLAYEIFMRCLEKSNRDDKIVLYDPCCGSGCLLTVIGILCGENIKKIYGSDISADAVKFAARNLALVNPEGLNQRRAELENLYNAMQKDSHLNALQSVEKIHEAVKTRDAEIISEIFTANILEENALKQATFKADIVIVDVPYGNLAAWENKTANNIAAMLDNINFVVHEDTIVAVSFDKGQKTSSANFSRIDKFQVGKRKIELLRRK